MKRRNLILGGLASLFGAGVATTIPEGYVNTCEVCGAKPVNGVCDCPETFSKDEVRQIIKETAEATAKAFFETDLTSATLHPDCVISAIKTDTGGIMPYKTTFAKTEM